MLYVKTDPLELYQNIRNNYNMPEDNNSIIVYTRRHLS